MERGLQTTGGALRRTLVTATLIPLVMLAACSGEDREEEKVPVLSSDTLPGTWSGLFPCGNCPGIDVTLWLRPDARFFLEQSYRADDVSSSQRDVTHALGRWEWQDVGQTLVLTGEGPRREFTRPDADTLFLHTASPLEHRLDRSASDFNFEDVITLRALVRASGDGYVLRECLTGYELPITKSGDYRRLAKQFPNIVPRGASAPLEFEGRFNWAKDGAPASVTVEHFIRLLSGGGCQGT